MLYIKLTICGGTGTEITVPTNTIQVPITTGTVTDSAQSVLALLGDKWLYIPELGISLFEIAQSLFVLERTFILGAMALLETKSEE